MSPMSATDATVYSLTNLRCVLKMLKEFLSDSCAISTAFIQRSPVIIPIGPSMGP